MSEIKEVYIIKQYQPCADYNGEVVAVFADYEKAVKRCRELNKEYSQGVEISDDCYDFEVNEDFEYDYIHAYIIDCFEISD